MQLRQDWPEAVAAGAGEQGPAGSGLILCFRMCLKLCDSTENNPIYLKKSNELT